MELNEYQNLAQETKTYPSSFSVIYPILGLTGEAGEVSDKLKKYIRSNQTQYVPLNLPHGERLEIIKELGDVLWNVAMAAQDLGFTLEDVATINIDKLKSRKERGVINGSGDNR